LTRCADILSKGSIDSDDSDGEALFDRPEFRRDAVLLERLAEAFCPAFGPLVASADASDKYISESPLHITVDDHQVYQVPDQGFKTLYFQRRECLVNSRGMPPFRSLHDIIFSPRFRYLHRDSV